MSIKRARTLFKQTTKLNPHLRWHEWDYGKSCAIYDPKNNVRLNLVELFYDTDKNGNLTALHGTIDITHQFTAKSLARAFANYVRI